MRKQEKEPFLPFVTVDDIARFDINDAATYTESRFINAVLRAIHCVGAANARKIASYLDLDMDTINKGVNIACGMSMTGLRSVATIVTAARMSAEGHKGLLDDVADRLGYGNRSSVWEILNNQKYADIVNRLCPELIQQRHQRKTEI